MNRVDKTVTVQPVIASEAKQPRGIASVVPHQAGLPRNDEGVSERLHKTLIVAGLILFWGARVLWAGISAEPNVIEKVMEPGATEEGVYLLSNIGQKKLVVSIEIEDWMNRLFEIRDEMDVHEWLKIETSQVTLDPGQKVELKYQVQAPANFTRERVAQVFFGFSEHPNLISRLGVIVYLSPKLEAKLKADILQLTAQSEMPEGQKEPQVALRFEIQNDSNVHIRPRGSVTILDESGKALKELAVMNVPGIYPGRKFTWVYRSPLKDIPRGFYKAKLALDYGALYGQTAVMEKSAEFDWDTVPVQR